MSNASIERRLDRIESALAEQTRGSGPECKIVRLGPGRYTAIRTGRIVEGNHIITDDIPLGVRREMLRKIRSGSFRTLGKLIPLEEGLAWLNSKEVAAIDTDEQTTTTTADSRAITPSHLVSLFTKRKD